MNKVQMNHNQMEDFYEMMMKVNYMTEYMNACMMKQFGIAIKADDISIESFEMVNSYAFKARFIDFGATLDSNAVAIEWKFNRDKFYYKRFSEKKWKDVTAEVIDRYVKDYEGIYIEEVYAITDEEEAF